MASRLKLIPQVRQMARLRHYSRRTEEAYVRWILRFVQFSGTRHPAELGEAEVSRFLSHLAIDGRVSSATQNQALAALLFLFRRVLGRELPWLDDLVRAKPTVRLPVVLAPHEVVALIGAMSWPSKLAAMLMYGSGLRLLEALTLRVKDVDFPGRQITVRRGKGGKDRVTMLPDGVVGPLRRHLAWGACGPPAGPGAGCRPSRVARGDRAQAAGGGA